MIQKKGFSANEYFSDTALLQLKTKHFISWIKRRIEEGFSGNVSHSSKVMGDLQHLIKVLFGPKDRLKGASSREERERLILGLLDSIRAEVLPGGATNFALRVWSDTPSNSSLGIFVKIGLPYARWSKQKAKCPVSRLNREFTALRRINEICPGVAPCPVICGSDSPVQEQITCPLPGISSQPILCGTDELVNDGTRYLTLEFLPYGYDKYLYDFKFGAVDKRPAEALGYTLAKVHVCAPSRWDKSSLLDETLLHFIANGHYKRVADDTQTYLRHTEFASSEVQSQFYISVDPEIALKHSKTLRKRSPELIRAMDRHLDNFLNPPTETATFTHLDTHLINVLVYSNAPTYDCAVDDPEYDPGALGVMKLIDMEFSNWGPAGGDLGLFIASAFFYALILSHSEEAIAGSHTIIDAIKGIWHAYRTAYVRYARLEGRSNDAIFLALYRIAHEAVGRAGLWIFRFTSPSLYPHVCLSEFLYPMRDESEQDLIQRELPDTKENALEVIRQAINTFAMDSLIAGFGDDAQERVENPTPYGLTLESCNEIMEEFVDGLISKRAELHETLQRTIPKSEPADVKYG